MESYVQKVLAPNERIVIEAKPHWALFIAPALVIFLTLPALSEETSSPISMIGIIFFLWRAMVYKSTEMALTDKRVIAKYGVIRRNMVDVSLSKVEGVTYSQGIIGRIFGYGSIIVRGSGVGQVPIRFISDPSIFQQKISEAMHG